MLYLNERLENHMTTFYMKHKNIFTITKTFYLNIQCIVSYLTMTHMSHADTSRIKHRHAKNKRQINKATEIAKISINIITATAV